MTAIAGGAREPDFPPRVAADSGSILDGSKAGKASCAALTEPAPRPNRALLLKLAIGAAVLLVGTVLVARGLDLKGLLQQVLELVRRAGPVAFFAGMALLPAVGVPITAFLFTAGPVFGPQFGLAWVIVLSLLAVTANMALTYFLASRAMRPLV
ncbi:MAG: hypothetical protein ABUL61_00035, partial [Oleiharenicola lentus]